MALLLFTGNALAQEPDTDIDREAREREKAMHQEELKSRKEVLEEQKEMQKKMAQEYYEQAEIMKARSREMVTTPEPFTSGIAYSDHLAPMFLFENQTQLTLRNNFNGGSDSSKGDFEVEKGTRCFRCMINGRVRSGKITIRVEYPGGKIFKELTITSAAEINYSQSLTIKEGEEAKYMGTWKYTIEAEKAEGNYMLQISTN
jgi:hypothetical protein